MALPAPLARLLGRDPARALFPPPERCDAAAREALLARPAPRLQHVTFFTPRSGSSWLGDVMSRSRRMGVVREAFNPAFLPKIAARLGTPDLDSYCAAIARHYCGRAGDVSGFQITHAQLRAVFGRSGAFLDRYAGLPCFWLLREDIVAQAVSLWKMQVTRLAHAPQADAAAIRAGDADLAYDGRAILRWLRHIRAAETGTERMLARAGLDPLRMSYERNVALSPGALADVAARHLGLDPRPLPPGPSPHRRIATRVNAEHAARFRAEHRAALDRLAEARAPMLARIRPYDAAGTASADQAAGSRDPKRRASS